MRQRLVVVAVVLLLCSIATPALSQDERTPILRLKELKAERLAAHPQATAVAMAAKTVNVDCSKGDTISAALAQNAGPVVIKVRGTCRENVAIERSDVTIRGTDPTRDGIQGVTANPQPDAALRLRYAIRIVLENLFVSNSPSVGVGAWWSALEMRNCRIEGNSGSGVNITSSSFMLGSELVVSSNAWIGVNCQRGSYVQCTGCRLEGNTSYAAASLSGGFMTLLDSVVGGGSRGIWARDAGSYVDVDCGFAGSDYPCGVNASLIAASGGLGGVAGLYAVGEFTGRVQAIGGRVYVYGGQQISGTYLPNLIWDGGWLETGIAQTGGTASRLGSTILSRFARAILWSGPELLDTLVCESGADAWSDTAYPASKVIGCANVLTTP